MNTIQKQISEDLKSAMLSKQEDVKSLLRVVIGEFNREGKEVPDERAVAIIKKMITNATELGNSREIEILNKYVPSQLSETEIINICNEYIIGVNLLNKTTMGDLMSYLKENYSGRYDGKLASQIIKKLLS